MKGQLQDKDDQTRNIVNEFKKEQSKNKQVIDYFTNVTTEAFLLSNPSKEFKIVCIKINGHILEPYFKAFDDGTLKMAQFDYLTTGWFKIKFNDELLMKYLLRYFKYYIRKDNAIKTQLKSQSKIKELNGEFSIEEDGIKLPEDIMKSIVKKIKKEPFSRENKGKQSYKTGIRGVRVFYRPRHTSNFNTLLKRDWIGFTNNTSKIYEYSEDGLKECANDIKQSSINNTVDFEGFAKSIIYKFYDVSSLESSEQKFIKILLKNIKKYKRIE